MIVALDTLGDMVLRQPFFTGLVDRGSDVTVVVRRGYDEILRYLDRRLNAIVTEIDPHTPPSADTWERLATLASSVAKLGPDTLIAAAHNRTYVDEWLVRQFPECESVGFANLLLPISILDAWRIDLPSGSGRPQLFTRAVHCSVDMHETEKYRALFQAVTGAPLADRPPTISLDEDLRQDAVITVRALGLEPGQYVFGCPAGTLTVALKAWPPEQYAQLAAYLNDRHHLPVLLAGSESEAPLLQEIRNAGETRGVRLPVWVGGAGSMGTLLGLIALSRVYFGNDTGPMHLAGALGVPVVARFGGGHWPRFVPAARRAFTATQQLPCFKCSWQCWLDNAACMTLIETDTFATGLDWALSSDDEERRTHLGRPLDHQLTQTVQALRTARLRLAVNLRTSWPGEIGGLGDAFHNVMDRLLSRHGAELEVTLFTSNANDQALTDWHTAVRRVHLPDHGWESVLATALARCDVLWCPLSFLDPSSPPIPSVVTMPDVHHEECDTPEVLADRLRHSRLSVMRATRVLTASEQSRQQILRTYGVPDDHVDVVALDARGVPSYDDAAEATWRVLRDAAQQPPAPAPVIAIRHRPKVLVVTPSFNQGRFLRETIESVLRQDYERIDYVVADGGSTDESVQILRSYGDRVRWTSGPDGGQAAAIARAWRDSDADILGWLNSDDTYLPGAISSAVDYLLNNPEAAMVYGQAWYTDVEGQRTRPYPTKPFERQALAGDCFICQPAAFVRRDVLEVVAPPDPALRYCMDYDLWIRLSKYFRIDYLERFLATSRMHAENKTLSQTEPMLQEIFAVVRRHFGGVHRAWIWEYANYRWERSLGQIPAMPKPIRERALAMLEDRLRGDLEGFLYEDRWAGRRTVVTVECDVRGQVHLDCECSPYAHPLRITASCDGQRLTTVEVSDSGSFVLAFELPAHARPRAQVLFEANRSFVPLLHGLSTDPRTLSFRILGQVLPASEPPSTVGESVHISPERLQTHPHAVARYG